MCQRPAGQGNTDKHGCCTTQAGYRLELAHFKGYTRGPTLDALYHDACERVLFTAEAGHHGACRKGGQQIRPHLRG